MVIFKKITFCGSYYDFIINHCYYKSIFPVIMLYILFYEFLNISNIIV